MTADEPLVAVRGLVKTYNALRPLRVESFTLARGEVVTIGGLDAAAAEMFVSLLTGATLPDSGEVRLFGQATSAVSDSDAWLRLLDGVGILTDRAVLIGQFSAEQNVAMPFTLEVDPLADEVRPRVARLMTEVGIRADAARGAVAEAGPEVQARVRLARALALDPVILLAEHPTATLPRDAVNAFGADLRRAAAARGLAVVALSADEAFARALGGPVLTHEPATGRLAPARGWRSWFTRA